MDLLILCSILFVGVIGGFYLKNYWREYGKGLSDGKKDLFARSDTAGYRRGIRRVYLKSLNQRFILAKGLSLIQALATPALPV